MKFYMVGEDLLKREVSSQKVFNLLGYIPQYNGEYPIDDDYHIIVAGGVDKPTESVFQTKFAPTERFGDLNGSLMHLLPPAPEGRENVGYRITMLDEGGEFAPQNVGTIPSQALRIGALTWQLENQLFKVYPLTSPIKVEACGECEGCIRYECKRRTEGIRCRNYKKGE